MIHKHLFPAQRKSENRLNDILNYSLLPARDMRKGFDAKVKILKRDLCVALIYLSSRQIHVQSQKNNMKCYFNVVFSNCRLGISASLKVSR